MNIPNAAEVLLTRKRDLHPDKPVFICADSTLSFRALDSASRRFAGWLRHEGVAPGDRVLIALPDGPDFPVAFLGAILCGAMAVAVDADLTPPELDRIVADCEPRLLVTREKPSLRRGVAGGGPKLLCCGDRGLPECALVRDGLREPHRPHPGDFAYMLYSSGSTGAPKGVPQGHGSLLLPCELTGDALYGLDGDDVIFSTSKMSFAYGLVNSLAFPLHFGATAVLHPGRPDADSLLSLIRRHRPSVLFSVPASYSRIILSCTDRKLKLPMRLCCSAGEALPAAVFHEWRRLTGLEIVDGIGSTELAYHFICNVPGRAVAGSAGRLIPGYRARLVDDAGREVPPGREGLLLISGPTASPRYWNLPEKSGNTMLADGFIRTGDLFLEWDGYFYHRGRDDDLIKVDGRWVSPAVVEEALRSHPAVADCAVAPVTLGTFTRTCAYVVPSPVAGDHDALAGELKGHIGSQLPDFMCPVSFRFVPCLPRTRTGKLQRRLLANPRAFLRGPGNNGAPVDDIDQEGCNDIRT